MLNISKLDQGEQETAQPYMLNISKLDQGGHPCIAS